MHLIMALVVPTITVAWRAVAHKVPGRWGTHRGFIVAA